MLEVLQESGLVVSSSVVSELQCGFSSKDVVSSDKNDKLGHSHSEVNYKGMRRDGEIAIAAIYLD